jgi:glycosyltransferase involved in cell wall biosynthesis
MVVTEALACGLPVIVTPNVGASDLIHDGQDGYVVPICSSDAITYRLLTLHRDRELFATMSRHAQATAAEYSWASYRANFANTLEAVIACH